MLRPHSYKSVKHVFKYGMRSGFGGTSGSSKIEMRVPFVRGEDCSTYAREPAFLQSHSLKLQPPVSVRPIVSIA